MKNLAESLAPELPYVRRFARALTGSQKRGDAYVVAMLEALVADRRNLSGDLPLRAGLYRSLLQVWNTMPLNHVTDPVERENGSVVDRRIDTLTPKARQAFLLAAVEEFSNAEIAAIMAVSESEVGTLISEAGKEIADQIAADVLIIEDEPLIALEIEGLVNDMGHRVVGIARTRSEAARMAQDKAPTLVLADVQLADGSSGIEAVNDILRGYTAPVIFVTAYPERLLTGERAEPAFLVPKPFRHDMLRAVISQALFFEIKAGGPTHRVGH